MENVSLASDIQFHESLVDDDDTWTIQVIYPEGTSAVPPLLCENDTLVSLDTTGLAAESNSPKSDLVFESNNQMLKNKSCSVVPESYKCPRCDKAYNAKRNLTRHINLECGKKPKFACPHCNYKNYRRNEIKKHVRSKHNMLWHSSNGAELMRKVCVLFLFLNVIRSLESITNR